MSVLKELTIVILTLNVSIIIQGASPVSVTKDTVGMELAVQVNSWLILCIIPTYYTYS